MLTSEKNECSKIIPVIKSRDKRTGQVSISLQTKKVKELNYQKDKKVGQEKMAGAFSTMADEFGDSKDNFIKVSSAGITIYNSDCKGRLKFGGTNIRTCMYIHDQYMYCLADPIDLPPTIIDTTQESEDVVPNHRYKSAGFYVYDCSQMMSGKLEAYRLYSSVVGVNTLMDNSRFSERFSFLSDFNHILVIPFPHMNTLNFIGMAQKKSYLIWRQNDELFTALDKEGSLITWSIITGRMLY